RSGRYVGPVAAAWWHSLSLLSAAVGCSSSRRNSVASMNRIRYRAVTDLVKCGHGVEAMKHMCVLLCAMLFCVGCAADGDNGQWEDFWKDVRGENMQMRSHFSE